LPHHDADRLPLVVDERPVLPLAGVCFCQAADGDTESPGHPFVGDPEQHLLERGEGS
jgi:hypothetical protein